MPGRSALMSSISGQNCRRDSGSMPVVGSSRMRRSGSWIRAQQSDELLLHAARELAGRPVGERIEPGRAQQALDARAPLARGLSEQAAEKVDVLEHRQARIEIAAQALRHVGDARRRCGRGAARRRCRRRACGCVPACRRRTPAMSAEQRRLADAVRADDSAVALPDGIDSVTPSSAAALAVAVRTRPRPRRQRAQSDDIGQPRRQGGRARPRRAATLT